MLGKATFGIDVKPKKVERIVNASGSKKKIKKNDVEGKAGQMGAYRCAFRRPPKCCYAKKKKLTKQSNMQVHQL